MRKKGEDLVLLKLTVVDFAGITPSFPHCGRRFHLPGAPGTLLEKGAAARPMSSVKPHPAVSFTVVFFFDSFFLRRHPLPPLNFIFMSS